ncbi:MAG TPA: acyltransferase [Conexibacter sp.]|nr:acyltransferase [Conexibacter sp.]
MARLFNELLRHLPDRAGRASRAWYLGRAAQAYGPGSIVGRGCRVLGPEQLAIGAGVIVARDVTLDARGGLQLDDEALIGFESVLLTHTHRSDEVGVAIQRQGMYSAPVRIGARAWLGMRVLVLPGVEIGDDAIVASGAVVSRSIPPRGVAAGVPARVLHLR